MPITDILHNPTRQALVERSSCILKEMLIKQKEKQRPCKDRLNSALLTFYFLKRKIQKGRETPVMLWEYVCFNPRCRIWGCFRSPTTADYDWTCALAGACVVLPAEDSLCLELQSLLGEYVYKCQSPKRGWWLLLPMLLLYCVAGLLVEDILTTKTGLSFRNLMSLSEGSRLRDLTFFLTDLGIRVEKSGR